MPTCWPSPARRVCLLLIDFYRYDKATQRLAEQAKRQGVDVVIFTDTFCSWAREITDKVFDLPTSTGLFWHSTAAFSVLLNLLVNDVIERLGERGARSASARCCRRRSCSISIAEDADDARPAMARTRRGIAWRRGCAPGCWRAAAVRSAGRGGAAAVAVSPASRCSAPSRSS